MEHNLWWKDILNACNSISFDLTEDQSTFLGRSRKTKTGVKYSCIGTTGTPRVQIDGPSSVQILIPYEAIYMEKLFYQLKDTYFTVEKKISGTILVAMVMDSAGFVTLKSIKLSEVKGDDKARKANSHQFVLRCMQIDVLPFDFNEDWVPKVPNSNTQYLTQFERKLMNNSAELSLWRRLRRGKMRTK